MFPRCERHDFAPCGRCAGIEDPLAGQRNRLDGLDALPIARPLRGPCPGGPSLRSGTRLAPAPAHDETVGLRSCGLDPDPTRRSATRGDPGVARLYAGARPRSGPGALPPIARTGPWVALSP